MTQRNTPENVLDPDVQSKVDVIVQAELDVVYREFAQVNSLPGVDYANPAATVERMEQFSAWVGETGVWFSAESIGNLVALKRARELEPEGALTFEDLVPYFNTQRVVGAEMLVIEARVSQSHIDVLLRRRLDS